MFWVWTLVQCTSFLLDGHQIILLAFKHLKHNLFLLFGHLIFTLLSLLKGISSYSFEQVFNLSTRMIMNNDEVTEELITDLTGILTDIPELNPGPQLRAKAYKQMKKMEEVNQMFIETMTIKLMIYV
jgi:hypothetical protein